MTALAKLPRIMPSTTHANPDRIIGDQVQVRIDPRGAWQRGLVSGVSFANPRSYDVTLWNGDVVRNTVDVRAA